MQLKLHQMLLPRDGHISTNLVSKNIAIKKQAFYMQKCKLNA